MDEDKIYSKFTPVLFDPSDGSISDGEPITVEICSKPTPDGYLCGLPHTDTDPDCKGRDDKGHGKKFNDKTAESLDKRENIRGFMKYNDKTNEALKKHEKDEEESK